MNLPFSETWVLICSFIAVVLVYFSWKTDHKVRRRRPDGSSKSVESSRDTRDFVGQLLSQVIALKRRDAQWPEILKTLNPGDEPRIRALLLELRLPHIFAPHTALNIIESVCESVNSAGHKPSKIELLALAKSSMERITRYGD
jgi:hypothetical protein